MFPLRRGFFETLSLASVINLPSEVIMIAKDLELMLFLVVNMSWPSVLDLIFRSSFCRRLAAWRLN